MLGEKENAHTAESKDTTVALAQVAENAASVECLVTIVAPAQIDLFLQRVLKVERSV